MAGIAIPQHGGRYRRAKFFFCLPPGMNRQLVLNVALIFKQEIRGFCSLRRMKLLPTVFFLRFITDILFSQKICFTS